MKIRLLILPLILFFCTNISSQEIIPKRVYNTLRLKDTPIIDGDISDKGWNEVSWSSDFVEQSPDEGTPPMFQTQFKVLYDSKFLYIAVRAFDDNPELIQQRLTRRDGFAGDRVNVMIDSYHDKRTAFVFTTTAAGVKGEEIASQNGEDLDSSWNPIWYTSAKVDDKGWSLEMKIPFSQLRFGNDKEQIWGLNIIRHNFRENERSLWQRIPNSQAGLISESGELHGLINLTSQKQLEIQPFTILQHDTYRAEIDNPYKDGSDFKVNAGLDAKIGVTNDLTLDLTINPDFGQVEADPGAIALDGFQVFFEEQRPFFVENKNIFDFEFANGSDNLFYSRRIGGSPHRNANTSPGEFANEPLNSTILGAAKFSGKTKKGWSIGVLQSVTSNEYAQIKQTDGEIRKEIVEPLTNYFVGRVQKDFNQRNSFIGGIFTATNRHLNGSFTELHKSAYSAGIDFQHNWKNRKYFIEGNGVISRVLGSEEAIEITQRSITHNFQRPGANYLDLNPNRRSLTGTGGKINIGKRGGDKFRYNAGFLWRSPELELNDIGFLRNTDEIIQFSNIRYLLQIPTEIYRNINFTLGQSNTYDFGGNLNKAEIEYRGSFKWINNWDTNIGGAININNFQNFFLRGGPRWNSPNNGYQYLFFGSNIAKKFSFRLGYIYAKSAEDIYEKNKYVFRMNYQPFDAFSMSLNTELDYVKNKTQYVTTLDFGSQKRYILGNIKNSTLSTTLRLNYSLNPNFSIQFYGQPFISTGIYSDFNYVNNPLASSLDNRINIYNALQISSDSNDYGNSNYLIDENLNSFTDYSFENPDFTFLQLQTNLVVRWEYVPGSELFFVWSKGASTSGYQNRSIVDSLFDPAIKLSAQDTFLIKATYRFIR